MNVLESLQGVLASFTPIWAAVVGILLVLLALGFAGAPIWAWALAGLVALVGFGAPWVLTAVFAVVAIVFVVPPIRRVLSLGVMQAM